MPSVNIYIKTTIKGPKSQDGAYCCLLELEGNPNTLDESGILKNMNEQQSQIYALTRALKHMRKPCVLSIYTDSAYFDNVFNGWLVKWQTNGWKTSKNKEVLEKGKLEEMLNLLNTHQFSIITKQSHSYSDWMERKCREEKNGV